jgi:GNAT superfamily N-acetyltransferase
MDISEWRKNDYLISTDKSKIDLDMVHHFLSASYWAENIPKPVVQKSIENSVCFGVYHQQDQIGFARVITDFATFAYLADVFILPGQRSKGLAKWLTQVIIEHPELQGLRRFTLATRDAHGLYAQFDFAPFDKPERWMQKHDPEVYKNKRR